MGLLANGVCMVGGGQTRGLGGVRRGAQGMRTHVRDCRGLSCRSGGGGRGRSAHLMCRGAAGEPAADLFRDVKLAAAKGSCSRDGITWTGIARGFLLEQPEHSLRAVSRPHGDESSFGFAQRLW